MKLVPTTGSPPMPTMVELPRPSWASSAPIWYVSVPDRETSPTPPCANTCAGMIPTFARPGDSAPGQLGPSRRMPRGRRYVYTSSISWAGMPSAMQTTSSTPASADS